MSRHPTPADTVSAELERLRGENQRLQALNLEAFDYIRAKVNELLDVVGTRTLRPEELDDHSLIALDPIGIVATTFRHVLENVRDTNRQLHAAHGEIQTIFDTVGSALLVVDPKRQIISFNKQTSRLLLCHDGDVVGHYCSEVLCGEDPALEHCVFLQTMKSGKESALRGKQLGDRFFDVLAGPIFDDNGQVSHVVLAYHEVTEARRVEQMKSEFVSTAAHELRTPLASIMGYAELLLNNPEQCQEHLHDSLKVILGRAEHLAHIVSDLLDISRIEAGEGVKMTFQSCHLDLLCKEVAWGHEDACESHPIELDLPAGGAVVEGDRYALSQVIENLLSNAIKYSPAGGAIRVSLRPGEDYCELSVTDQGIGMTTAQLDHVFEKFYRANATDSAIPGTGLGMTIVKYLVEAHHGQVIIESTPGAGTTVRVRLPRTHVPAE